MNDVKLVDWLDNQYPSWRLITNDPFEAVSMLDRDMADILRDANYSDEEISELELDTPEGQAAALDFMRDCYGEDYENT